MLLVGWQEQHPACKNLASAADNQLAFNIAQFLFKGLDMPTHDASLCLEKVFGMIIFQAPTMTVTVGIHRLYHWAMAKCCLIHIQACWCVTKESEWKLAKYSLGGCSKADGSEFNKMPTWIIPYNSSPTIYHQIYPKLRISCAALGRLIFMH